MKETNENKAKYFGCHLYQYISHPAYNGDLTVLTESYLSVLSDREYIGYYVVLKPLEAISDEDVKEVAKINGCENPHTTYGYRCLVSFGINHFPCGQSIEISINPHPHTLDFLRSKGYATDWNGYTVEQLIAAGWLQLTPNKG